VGLLADRADLLERADAAARTTWGTVAAFPRSAPAALTDVLRADEARKGLGPAVAVVLDAEGDPLNAAARAAWRMAPAGTVIVTGRPGTRGFAHHFDERTVRPAGDASAGETSVAEASASETSGGAGGITHATVSGSGLVEADEYDEHEVVPTEQTVYVCRGVTCFAPASTVQEIRRALWTRA